jgi:hypothetical protein
MKETWLRINKDLIASAQFMSVDQARFLVDTYYQIQDERIRANAQVRSTLDSGEPHSLLEYIGEVNKELEGKIKLALGRYAKGQSTGQWSLSICGIGPVLASGLLSHIDIEKAPTVGHIWAFAGLDPTRKWEKKTKRPWNAKLKCLCWKIGESFIKQQTRPKDIYGAIYASRRVLEDQRNDAGAFAAQAKEGAARVKKTTEAWKHYSTGKLPPGHIKARASRYAVKLFLSHWHETAYRNHFGKEPPLPYPVGILGHAHKVAVA